MSHKTRSSGAIIVGPDGRVVVVSQNGDSWSLPKGTLEKDETPEQAARREIKEETGLTDFVFIKNLGSYQRPTIAKGGVGEDTEHIKEITLFLAKTEQTELKPIDPHNPEALWVNPEDVSGMLTHAKDKEFYEEQLPEIALLQQKA